MPELNPVAKKWVEALRSGEYRQGTGVLRRPEAEGDKFCCLGVLCELAIEDGVLSPPVLDVDAYFYAGNLTGILPEIVRRWSGLYSSSGDSKCNLSLNSIIPVSRLTCLNDGGATFTEIADIIEKHAEDLFA